MAPRFARSAAAAILAASLALVAACNGQTSADPSPTTTQASTDNSPSPMSANGTTNSSSITSATSASIPPELPSTLTPSQVADAQSAIAAYTGYSELYDAALADPAAAGWDQAITNWAADPEKTSFLQVISGTAKAGQYVVGSVEFTPTVTTVEPALVTMSVCVDSTHVDFFNAAGQSIKAPNQPGSYWRHPTTVTVAKYQTSDPTHEWLVTTVTGDATKTC